MAVPPVLRWSILVSILALPILVSIQAPPSFIHPDEQTAAYQARTFLGDPPRPPEDLGNHSGAFVPFNTIYDEANPLATGFHAAGSIGFAYPMYLSPLLLAGPHVAYLSGALALLLLYVGAVLFLDPRSRLSWLLALIVVTIPPVLLHSILLFSNLPGLALYVLGVGIVTEALRTRRTYLLALGLFSVLAAAAVRRDFLVSSLLLTALLGVVLAMRPADPANRAEKARALAAWASVLTVTLLVSLVVFRAVNGSWGIPYAHTPEESPGTNLSTLASVQESLAAEVERRWGSSTDTLLRLTKDNYLFGFVPAVLVLGALGLARTSRESQNLWLLLPLGAHGLVVWLLTAGTVQYGTGCACVDASHPRYFFPIYGSLALVGCVFLRDALRRIRPGRARSVLAVALVAMIAVPSVAHAYGGEQGIAWALARRTGHHHHEELAQQLPPNAIVVGDYLSKIVYSRPVLVPAHVGDRLPEVLLDIDGLGRPAYVHLWWALRDETKKPYGPLLLSSGHFTFEPTGIGDLHRVVRTNATVRNVFSLTAGEWPEDPSVAAFAPAPRAHFRPIQRDGVSLPVGDSTLHNGTLKLVYLEPEPGRALRVGFGDVDGRAGTVLASWNTTSQGAWRVAHVAIPKDAHVLGQFYVEGFARIHSIEVSWGASP